MSIYNHNENKGRDELVTYIFPDFRAVSYFERDIINCPEFHSIKESQTSGIDIYLVEQWALSRKIGSLIATYSGNNESKVTVLKLTVFKKPLQYYPEKFQEYINELMLNHAKIKPMSSDEDRPQELLFLTNPSVLPSNINLLPTQNSKFNEVEENFVVNSNLKRMHCSGRSLFLLKNDVSSACEDKFRNVFRIYNTDMPIKVAIKEIVNLVQTCLFYFALLDVKYCDGLICDRTEESIIEWWNRIGSPRLGGDIDENGPLFSPQTVAGIVSLLLSAKLRISMVGGCDVPKDPFEYENFMISIGQLQKQFKFEKTRRLNLQTLNKLFSVTSSKSLNEKKPTVSPPENNQDNDALVKDAAVLTKPDPTYKNKFKSMKKKIHHQLVGHGREAENVRKDPNIASSGAKLRSKIAKLADVSSPSEIETLDLEFLVNNYITGKTLARLWREKVNSNRHFPGSSLENSHSSPHNKLNRNLAAKKNSDYQFESLKDKITTSYLREVSTASTSKGFNRKKPSFQNRRILFPENDRVNLSDSQPGSTNSESFSNVNYSNQENFNAALDFPKPEVLRSLSLESLEGGGLKRKQEENNAIFKFKRNLNRRSSYPIVIKDEASLNVLEYCRQGTSINVHRREIPRSSSFSLLENHFCNKNTNNIVSVDTLARNHLHYVYFFLRNFHFFRQRPDSVNVEDIKKKISLLMTSLSKFNKLRLRTMKNHRLIFEGEMITNIDFCIEDLEESIDKLEYEAQIVTTRIDELEEECNIFTNKINEETIKTMNKITNEVIYLDAFYSVYSDPHERKRIISYLTGSETASENSSPTEEKNANKGFFWMVFIFIYDLISYLLQLTKFDISKLNINRIKQSWQKVDPNRQYITKLYSMTGGPPPEVYQPKEEDDDDDFVDY